jgi:hypothetical protein
MLSLLLALALIQSPPEQFESVALSWMGAEQQVRVRASADGVTWSEWMPMPIDTDSSIDGRVHFGSAMRYLQTDRPAKATFFAPPPARRRVVPYSLSVGQVLARSRSDWGCPDGQAAKDWTPAYTTVTHAVVHHTAGSNNVTNWEAEMRSVWQLHTFTNGWGDIGYNFLIDPNGVVYEGRAGGHGAIGAHFSCRNTNTVGIALLGTYSTVVPTQAALDSLKKLLAEVTTRHHIDPLAFALHAPSQLLVPTIMTHRDGNTSPLTCTRTECPGDALYALMPSIRTDVATIKVGAPRRRSVRK